jgi:hypothetical protein
MAYSWIQKLVPLTKFGLRSLLVAMVLLSLLIALIIKERRSSEREYELKKQLFQARFAPVADKRMRSILSDLGIVILKDAPLVEELRVTGKGSTLASYPVALTGRVFGKPFVSRLANELTDYKQFMFMDTSDDPEPRFGFRLTRRRECLDALFSVVGNHVDMWIIVRNENGEIVHEAGKCMYSDSLKSLVTHPE